MRRKTKEKLLTVLLFMAMILAIMPVLGVSQTAYADNEVTYLDEDGKTETATVNAFITGETTTLPEGWYAVNENVNLTGLSLTGNVNIILCDNKKLTVNNTSGDGITSTGDLTIYAQSKGSAMGKLDVTGNNGIETGEDLVVVGGDVKATGNAAGGYAIRAERNVTISGGTVTATATGDNGNAISASNYIALMGGSVTASASGAGTGCGIDVINNVQLGSSVKVWAGSSASDANDVTATFVNNHGQKWVQTETTTLWVGGIPVTSRNAENILGDAGATARYDYSTETLTLNNYSYESEGHEFGPDKMLYAAIYADQDLSIQLEGKNTVKCTEQEGSDGSGIYSTGKALTISGSGTLNATGYGQSGIGIQTHKKDITINGGTVTASGHNGLSDTEGKIKVNGGIVTVIGNGDKGISSDENSIVVADKMGINAGDSKETAIAVDKKDFETNHPQHWVQISEAYPLWVRGVWVMVTNKDDVLGDGKVSYDPNANTLKLNGATITAGDKDSNGIKYSGEIPLNIESKSGSVNTVNGDNNCIYSSGDGQLIFLGGGTLNVTASGSNGCGIKSDAGIVIKEGSNLTVRGKAKAIDGTLKNYITGTGWTDYDGMTKGQSIKTQIGSVNYKKVQFPEVVSGTPTAKMKAGKTSITMAWNKIQGADGYDIFFAPCNKNDKKNTCKNVKSISGNNTFKWTNSGLKKGTAYKSYVKAYVIRDGKKTYISTSPVMHAYTGGGNKKYTNAKSVTVKKKKVSLKKGKTYKIKAKVNKLKKGKKLMPKSHAPKLRYLTSDSSVATVNAKGKITAKGSGTCTITVFAHNGVSKNVKVTVK